MLSMRMSIRNTIQASAHAARNAIVVNLKLTVDTLDTSLRQRRELILVETGMGLTLCSISCA
jgi:hypothetical protein